MLNTMMGNENKSFAKLFVQAKLLLSFPIMVFNMMKLLVVLFITLYLRETFSWINFFKLILMLYMLRTKRSVVQKKW